MPKRLLITLLLFAFVGLCNAQTGIYIVKGNVVNVRSGPGTQYSVIGSYQKGATVTVMDNANEDWAKINYGETVGYMSRRYIDFKEPLPDEQSGMENSGSQWSEAGSFWDWLFKFVKPILWICGIIFLIGSMADSEKAGFFLLPLLACGIGAIIGGAFFDNGRAGADIGMMLTILLFIKMVSNALDISGLGSFTYIMWYIISLPFYIFDRLQFFLSKPWRVFLKNDWISDRMKPAVRTALNVLKVPFYIALFPLRFLNAVYYNLLIHNLYELSNYLLEVVMPSDEQEGRKNILIWIVKIPYRIAKYVLYHGFITFLESIIWTVIDTFVPALTLYHGTQKEATDSMLCDPKRNSMREEESGWLSGIWNVGSGNYAGDGIYFGIYRRTLLNYQNGSAIVARVTPGKTIDVSLMPYGVNMHAGYPNAKAVSNWGLDNGYVTGEWWRGDRDTKWWEFCLYDRQNRYNDSWRIRPIYAINSNSGIMQRIPGGMTHWLFQKMAWNDLKSSVKKAFR